MALSTDARHELAELLRAAGLPAFASVPATITLPSVQLVPDTPYLTPDRVGPRLAYSQALRIGCLVQASDNEGGLAACEELVDDVLTALPTGLNVTRVEPPGLMSLGAQGTAYVAEISTTLHLTAPPPVTPVPPSQPGLPTAVDWRPAQPGWYTVTVVWIAPTDEGSSPITHYLVTADGVTQATDSPDPQVVGLLVEAGRTAEVFVVAVNSETQSIPSETALLQSPPT